MSEAQSGTTPPMSPKDAAPATQQANQSMRAALPFEDRADFEAAGRGLIERLPEGVIKTESGTVVWNLKSYDFLNGRDAPPTVNPSLWRMAQLNLENGLFKVVDRVYQLRGLDLANMTVIE
ncbi:MAG TPA: MBL fold metallo-hydrolase, partial [Vineibacter sp.]|nr:MBL fold metallo-hydrolase [Vineibacter sp.]